MCVKLPALTIFPASDTGRDYTFDRRLKLQTGIQPFEFHTLLIDEPLLDSDRQTSAVFWLYEPNFIDS